MKLYRGDSLPHVVLTASRKSRGKTFADYFCGNGLSAKFGDRGHSDLLRGKSLRQLVEEHVGYIVSSDPKKPTPSERLALFSPMLSFAPSRDRAFEFAERNEKKRLNLEECPFENATHFVWELDVDLPTAATSPGVFEFIYYADPHNCRDIVERQLGEGIAEISNGGAATNLMAALGSAFAMGHAEADASPHFARLIDATTILADDRHGADPVVLERARKFATRDDEWLLYPSDPMPDGCGLSATFVMNMHLKVAGTYRQRPGEHRPT